MSLCNDSNAALLSVNNPSPVQWSMGQGVPGSLDGLYLYPGGASTWRKQPNNVPLLKGKLFVPQGTPVPLRCESVYQSPPENSMFYFARNIASPLCCPSTYSTMGGCVCTTPQQRALLGVMRGGNSTYPNYEF
jgi:hypothetical protein